LKNQPAAYAAQILGKETWMEWIFKLESPCPKRLSEPPIPTPLPPYQTPKEHKRLNEPLIHASSTISRMTHIYKNKYIEIWTWISKYKYKYGYIIIKLLNEPLYSKTSMNPYSA
jgi:hypothetical protein